MANIKVSEMPEATSVSPEDLIMLIQGGGNKKVTTNTLLGDSVIVSPTEPVGDDRRKVWFRKGKNLLDLSNIIAEVTKGITISKNGDGSITFNGTTTEEFLLRIPIYLTLSAGTYTHSITNDSIKTYFSLDNLNNTMIIPSTNFKKFTIKKETKYKEYYIWAPSGTTFNNYTFYPMICQGEDTIYEAYIEPQVYVRNSNGVYEKFENNSFTIITENDWIIKKYNNGYFEAWLPQSATRTTSINTAWGGLYTTPSITLESPSITKTLMFANVNASPTNAYGFALSFIENKNIIFRILSNSSQTSITYRLASYVAGTWE